MDRFVGQARLAIALIQCALFTVGLTHGLYLGSGLEHPPSIELAWLDASPEATATRRPPRWPGRSKMAKGLAIREASALKPTARSI